MNDFTIFNVPRRTFRRNSLIIFGISSIPIFSVIYACMYACMNVMCINRSCFPRQKAWKMVNTIANRKSKASGKLTGRSPEERKNELFEHFKTLLGTPIHESIEE